MNVGHFLGVRAGVAWGRGALLTGQLAGVIRDQGCVPELRGCVASEENARTFDEGQQDAAHRRRARHGQRAAAGGQHGPRHRPAGDGVPGVLLVPQPRQAAVNGGEQAPPHREAPSNLGHSGPHGVDTTPQSVPSSNRGVLEALQGLEDATPDDAHSEGSSAVVHHPPRAGLPRVPLHGALEFWCRGRNGRLRTNEPGLQVWVGPG